MAENAKLARVAEQLAPRRGTLEERNAWTEARREAWRERDAARARLAGELGARARFSIPEEKGFLVLPPATIDEAGAVITAGNELIESIGHERLLAKYNPKKDTMSRGFLPEDARELGSPYMRFALSEDVLAPISAYLGVVPVLLNIDIWYAYAPPAEEGPRNAQLWHLDGDDTTQVKVWIHLQDVIPESGPLTALDASLSDAFAEEIDYDSSVEYRIPDEKVESFTRDDSLTLFDGPAGTIDFVDTSRCFHFGSRVDEGSPVRRVFFAKYVTPYAFSFKEDHRQEAPFRDLVSGSSSELESLVLGAA
jgi:hypothetical protein